MGIESNFPTPAAVVAFNYDVQELGPVCDGHNWFITPEWAIRFQRHLDALLILASEGSVTAQYSVAQIYMLGFVYSSEAEGIAHGAADSEHMCYWLHRAAASGHIGALDNLLAIGASEEAARLRTLWKENASEFEEAPATSKGWERDMHKLHKLAYGVSGREHR